jgi:hypothetical protein
MGTIEENERNYRLCIRQLVEFKSICERFIGESHDISLDQLISTKRDTTFFLQNHFNKNTEINRRLKELEGIEVSKQRENLNSILKTIFIVLIPFYFIYFFYNIYRTKAQDIINVRLMISSIDSLLFVIKDEVAPS